MCVTNYPVAVVFALAAVLCFFRGHAQQDTASTIIGNSQRGNRILVINAYDVNAARFRKNKTGLFHRLTDTLLQAMQVRLAVASGKTILLTGHSFDAADPSDSSLLRLEDSQLADGALIIRSVDVGFEQVKVEVSRDAGGTHRQASYNIYSEVLYQWYRHDSLVNEKNVRIIHYHSTRSVMSGLFAAGPNIIENEADAIAIVKENAIEYCVTYFPGDGKQKPRLEKAGFHF
ncbi:MAG: hypothetical protein KGO82_02860 [Bacteroidota bacterium]|nr:hypothetical protein [Bacteroidota bacterium]